ncbi:MAG: hypothetical protein J5608_00375 [Alphaproteobacteria bacterium]|nr:hypothetical protein [Alphaproteobacteria bacterium]
MNFLSVLAVIGCVAATDALANRSEMYSSIDMRNSNGDTISVKRGNADGYSSTTTRRYERRNVRSTGAYDNGNNSTYERGYARTETSTSTKRREDTYTNSVKRKYFIANPFYQPLQGQVGSVTTGEYLQGTYKFTSPTGGVDRKLGEWSIKEDLSFGITDRIALQGMAKYNNDKLTWEDDQGAGKHTYKSHDLNVYGLGVQGRIVDTNEWISTLAGYYEHQEEGINYYIADFKLGYKVARSTIYGLLRGWAVDMDGDVYGDYMEEESLNQWGMLRYGDANDTLFMAELGMGVWSVLAEDWTLNVEGLYGSYDWHDQFSIKGAIGFQPNDWFALNLYAKTSLYDSANDKHLKLREGTLPMTHEAWNAAPVVDVDVSKFREWSVGLQVMFQF